MLMWWYIQIGNSWSHCSILLPTTGDLGKVFSWPPKPGIKGFEKPGIPPSLCVSFCFVFCSFSFPDWLLLFSHVTHKAGNTPQFPGFHQMGPVTQKLATSPFVSQFPISWKERPIGYTWPCSSLDQAATYGEGRIISSEIWQGWGGRGGWSNFQKHGYRGGDQD